MVSLEYPVVGHPPSQFLYQLNCLMVPGTCCLNSHWTELLVLLLSITKRKKESYMVLIVNCSVTWAYLCVMQNDNGVQENDAARSDRSQRSRECRRSTGACFGSAASTLYVRVVAGRVSKSSSAETATDWLLILSCIDAHIYTVSEVHHNFVFRITRVKKSEPTLITF